MTPRLHIITDTTVQNKYSHFELAEMAFSAGPVVVQYRNKHYRPDRDLEELMRIAEMARRKGGVLIVNDQSQLAFQVGAQGVHLGKEDGPVEQAQALLGAEALIGATVHDRAELEALRSSKVAYIGVGPVYGTRSKQTGLPDLGLAGLRDLCHHSPWPVIAIGGIGMEQIAEVIEAGAYGCAVISAFCMADNPEKSARKMLEILEKA